MTIGSYGYDPKDNALVSRMREEEQERRLQKERETRAEVMPFEQEKQLVNRQVAENLAIHGPSDLSRYPIETDDSGRKA